MDTVGQAPFYLARNFRENRERILKILSVLRVILFVALIVGSLPWPSLAQDKVIIQNIKVKTISNHHSFISRGSKQQIQVYDILCIGHDVGREVFYSDRLFDTWDGLPDFVKKATRVTINCDQYGHLWALTVFYQPDLKSDRYTQRNYLYDTTKKKILYEKAIINSEEYLATWIHISPEGKYLAEVDTMEGGGAAEISEILDAKTFKSIPGLENLVELRNLFMGERYIYGVFKDEETESRTDCIFDTQTSVCTPVDTSYGLFTYVDLPGRGMLFGQAELENYTGDDYLLKLPGLQRYFPPPDLDNGVPFRNRQGSVIGVYNEHGASFYDQNLGLLKFYQSTPNKTDSILELDPEIKDGKVVQGDNRVVVGTYNGITGNYEKYQMGQGPLSPTVDWTDDEGGGIISVFPDSRSNGFWMIFYEDNSHSLIAYVGENLKIQKILRTDYRLGGYCRFDPDRYAILVVGKPNEMWVFPLN